MSWRSEARDAERRAEAHARLGRFYESLRTRFVAVAALRAQTSDALAVTDEDLERLEANFREIARLGDQCANDASDARERLKEHLKERAP